MRLDLIKGSVYEKYLEAFSEEIPVTNAIYGDKFKYFIYDGCGNVIGRGSTAPLAWLDAKNRLIIS